MNDITEDSYTATITQIDNETGRFYLHTSSKTLSTEDPTLETNTVNIFKSGTKQITISGLTTNATVKIYSILGKEVANTEITNNNTQLDFNNLSSGVYIVKLQSQNTEISKKVVLE